MPIWPVLTKIMSITRTPSGMVCTEGGSLGKGFVLVQPLRRSAPAPLVGEPLHGAKPILFAKASPTRGGGKTVRF
mgnify:CR=1 FL=1